MTIKVSDDSFDQDVLQAPGPVLLDLFADWCGPCRMVAPILEELAQEFEGRLTIAKINIDENPKTPVKYGVQGIPTMILFKNGEKVATTVGSRPKSKLKEWLESVL